MSNAAKIALLSAFILRPGLWDEVAEAWSRLIPHDWPGEHQEHIRADVESGRAHLLDCVNDYTGERVGFVVAAVDKSFPEPELLIRAAYSAAGPAHNLTAEVLPQIYAHARELGCRTIRCHTMRPGLVSKLMRAGWHPSEIVCRFDLANNV